jgi:hypothetical protein
MKNVKLYGTFRLESSSSSSLLPVQYVNGKLNDEQSYRRVSFRESRYDKKIGEIRRVPLQAEDYDNCFMRN